VWLRIASDHSQNLYPSSTTRQSSSVQTSTTESQRPRRRRQVFQPSRGELTCGLDVNYNARANRITLAVWRVHPAENRDWYCQPVTPSSFTKALCFLRRLEGRDKIDKTNICCQIQRHCQLPSISSHSTPLAPTSNNLPHIFQISERLIKSLVQELKKEKQIPHPMYHCFSVASHCSGAA
jgi:hypothetical protein